MTIKELINFGNYNDKQLRTFACWCAKRHWNDLDNNHRQCILASQRYIKSEITKEQMTAVKDYAAHNNDISRAKSKANVSARACCTVDAKQSANRSALASIAYSNNKTAANEVICYLIFIDNLN